MKINQVLVFTDGSCLLQNRRKFGIGVVIITNFKNPNNIIKYGRFLGYNGTNNIAELNAIKYGLEKSIGFNKPIIIYTDSKYSIYSITGQYKCKSNLKLINSIKQIINNHPYLIRFNYVKGHSKNTFNNLADKLAITSTYTEKNYG